MQIHPQVSTNGNTIHGFSKGQKSGGAGSTVVGIISPLVEIGLTDLPKSGGAAAPLPSPLLHPCSLYLRPTAYLLQI